jgi:hypothetical protein
MTETGRSGVFTRRRPSASPREERGAGPWEKGGPKPGPS